MRRFEPLRNTNHRKDKRHERRHFTPVEQAYLNGNADAWFGDYENPYPPGRRHDEYERGYHVTEEKTR